MPSLLHIRPHLAALATAKHIPPVFEWDGNRVYQQGRRTIPHWRSIVPDTCKSIYVCRNVDDWRFRYTVAVIMEHLPICQDKDTIDIDRRGRIGKQRKWHCCRISYGVLGNGGDRGMDSKPSPVVDSCGNRYSTRLQLNSLDEFSDNTKQRDWFKGVRLGMRNGLLVRGELGVKRKEIFGLSIT